MNWMQRRRAAMMGAKKSSRLPGEYQEVEWIGYEDSNRLLNTNVSGASVAKIRVKLAKLSVINQNTVFPCAFNGDTYVSTPYNFIETVTKFSTTPTVTSADTYGMTEFVMTKMAAFNYNIGLGYQNGWCPVLHFGQIDFYDDLDNLISSQVPCYRKSDNAVGLYDIVNHRFNPGINNGIQVWIKGNDI